jgi:MSHA biogenesis protein MshP
MNKQSGITLIGAIFVLVIVSLLGQYLVNIVGVQQRTTVMALQSARAYQAAKAGIDWAAASINTNNICPAAAPTQFSLIPGFTVTLSCSLLGSYEENLTTTNIFHLTSKAEFGTYGQRDYVSRSLDVTIHH